MPGPAAVRENCLITGAELTQSVWGQECGWLGCVCVLYVSISNFRLV